MAPYTFQEQLLSVMEIVAKAATEEINRRVADSCAVIRVELSRSQKDIDSLKKKCQLMENELKKVRGRGKRKVFFYSSSERLPFQGLCDRNTDVEQSVPPTQQEESEASTQHIHQILEDRSSVTTIKEERNENQTWSSGDGAGHFLYERHSNRSHITAQETMEEQNRFSEDMESQRTHRSHISSPVAAAKIHPSSLRLRVKTEKEEDDEKEMKVILLEGSEQRRENTSPSELAYNNDNVSDADKSFTPPELSCGLQSSVFSQHVMEATVEQSGNKAKTTPDDPIEMYSVGQVGVQEPQPAWNTDGSHQTDHRRRHGSSTYQYRRALSRPGEDRLSVSMACQPGPNLTNQTFLGRGRGGFRRSRTPWVTSVDGERRFRCSFCERTFMRFGQLKEHMRSHTGERPYTCNQCGRSFTKQGNLIRHAVVHSGEKPYQCSLCGKCFTQRSSLKSHQKTHTPDRDRVLQGLAVRQLVREPQDNLALTHTRGFV